MSDIRVNDLVFERGIESIAYYDKATAQTRLPERYNLPPTTDTVKAQVSELLDKPNISSFLHESLKPTITDRDLLMPGKFNQALRDTLTSFTQAAEQGGENAKTLNRAVRLLKDEIGLRDLVTMYCSALYQG